MAANSNSGMWKPAGGGDFTTFAEAYAHLIAPHKDPCAVHLGGDGDGPYVIPAAGGPWDLKSCTFLSSDISRRPTIVLEDGAVIRNPGYLINVVVQGSPTAAPCIELDAGDPGRPAAILFRLGGRLENLGSVPMIEVPAGTIVVFGMFDQAGGFVVGGLSGTIANLAPGAFAAMFLGFGSANLTLDDGAITGDATSTFLIAHDGTLPHEWPFFKPTYLGTVSNFALGKSGGAGPTANRPDASVLGPLLVGTTYFNTDLLASEVWDGSAWGALGAAGLALTGDAGGALPAVLVLAASGAGGVFPIMDGVDTQKVKRAADFGAFVFTTNANQTILTTPDATPVQVIDDPEGNALSGNEVSQYVARVTAQSADRVDAWSATIEATAQTVGGGAPAFVAAPVSSVPVATAGAALWSATLVVVTGTDVRVEVTGDVAREVAWLVTVERRRIA